MKKLLREPLVHFLALGLLVFLTDYLWAGGLDSNDQTIVVSQSVLARLDDTWIRTTGAAPSDEDRKGLVAQYVEDEALAREAGRLGMAEGDEIIKRRLAQKMRFVAAGSESDIEPSESELERWFEKNRDKFNISETRSFNHIYFSPERHGDALEAVADGAREKLQNGADWKSLGDPFMQKRSYAALPQNEVARAFGPDFAKAVFALPKGQWSKPVGSAFGLHLVRIEVIDQAAKADFAANRDRIRAAYIEAKAGEENQAEIDRIVGRYKVVVAQTKEPAR
ncbi:peptidyl-prolyl cis-trans isomerase [Parasphingorhabdus halotolerans]|uniref:Parvulin-like PPIase n=1 Tax=Parasphingorhabdus halotolerans TaxID=2725558 RepID=A0A6H2DP75_9SPHN|nr:peptidylprolyl isomerase [Parasphingorhabdus halotolerans]QJB69998.1 peptidyl-prolyl cis-trans isomerase [Parasphingorhabdus halotolerans]